MQIFVTHPAVVDREAIGEVRRIAHHETAQMGGDQISLLTKRIEALEAALRSATQPQANLSDAHSARIRQFIEASRGARVFGRPNLVQPTLFCGRGEIVIGDSVNFGFAPSPYLFSGYIYVEARNPDTKISFGDNVALNNNCMLCAEGEGIRIGARTIMGTNVEIVDLDFHELEPDTRMNSGGQKTGLVTIGANVFVGANVRILKAVEIGDNTVIANSAVVTTSLPVGVIAAGIPARVIAQL